MVENEKITNLDELGDEFYSLSQKVEALLNIASEKEEKLFGVHPKEDTVKEEKEIKYNGLFDFVFGTKNKINKNLTKIQDFLFKI